MIENRQVCEEIERLYPDMGSCGEGLDVKWDAENQAWAVDFHLNGEKIRHYLENQDAAACILGHQCLGMGIEFGQFH